MPDLDPVNIFPTPVLPPVSPDPTVKPVDARLVTLAEDLEESRADLRDWAAAYIRQEPPAQVVALAELLEPFASPESFSSYQFKATVGFARLAVTEYILGLFPNQTPGPFADLKS